MNRVVLAATFLFVQLANSALVGAGAAEARTPTGEWRVTKLTGAVDYWSEGPAPPDGLCEPGMDTYQARRQDSFIELAIRDDPEEIGAKYAAAAVNEIVTLGLPGGEALAALSQAFGGIEGYIETWFSDESGPAFSNTNIRILGIEALQSGEWRFLETSQLLECTSRASGEGSWEATAR